MFYSLLCLSLCHNVVIQNRDDELDDEDDENISVGGTAHKKRPKMEAQSPDELALICG